MAKCSKSTPPTPSPTPTPPAPQKLRRALLKWYDAHHRHLPWRAEPGQQPDPYHVFVSEAMLQQTQVATVIDYFNRFIGVFPSVAALAGADEQNVLRQWQGLGYYRRARNLHAAAKQIVDENGGRIPDTAEQLLKLPGVGRYTAGAIASIAFGKREPLLDGNVARVLARWHAIEQPIDSPATQKQLWLLAGQLVPAKRAGDFNQAMMELGALVCLPRNPLCGDCPVATMCKAYQQGVPERLPVKLPRKLPKPVQHHVIALHRGGQYLFQQRPSRGLWSNMWQMPTVEDAPKRSQTNIHIKQWVSQHLGLNITPPKQAAQFAHQTTHRTIGFICWTADVESGRLRPGRGQWRKLDKINDLPLPNPQRRVVQILTKTSRSGH